MCIYVLFTNTKTNLPTFIVKIGQKKKDNSLCGVSTDNLYNKYNLDNFFYAAAAASVLFMLSFVSMFKELRELRDNSLSCLFLA